MVKNEIVSQRPLAAAVLTVRNLSVSLGVKAILSDCSLQIMAGVTCIMSMSGTGKTTFLKTLVGLLVPDAGEILFEGHNVTHPAEKEQFRCQTAFVFQSGALFTSMDVYDNIAFALREREHLSELAVRKRVIESLERVGLEDAIHYMPSELSGGMVKRAAIARALALKPRLLLVDEPETGADPIAASRLMREIRAVTGADSPIASVVATHDVKDVLRFADYVALLIDGRVAWFGMAQEMKTSQNRFLQQFEHGALIIV